MNRDDEFYVGYAAAPPRVVARVVRRAVLGLVILAAALAVLLAASQRTFAPSAFEFGRYRDFEGVVSKRPYPSLLVRRPGLTGGEFPFSRYWLVAPGKHGATAVVAGLEGWRVKLRGALIYRAGTTLVELAPGAPPVASVMAGRADAAADLGRVSLSGEIVDSKCYFGVMNPGNGKVHRDCAARCISGGIPPAFIARDAAGQRITLLLAGSDGRPLNREILDWVAEPVTIQGELVRSGETLILRAEPRSFVRGGIQ